jgi:hypothetical protein
MEYQLQTMSAKEIRAQVNLIQEVMKAVMKDGTHYGKIPGCDKPTLLKPGSEKILSTFGIAVRPIVEDLSDSDKVHYRVMTEGYRNGILVGTGIGECSSDEEKYKWRRITCEQEWDATPEDRRRVKWSKPFNKEAYSVKQVRTEIADVANTVLKMAKKRSQIDLTLTATAASDIFTQDIEDLPEEYRETEDKPVKEPVKMPKAKRPDVTYEAPNTEIPNCPECGKPLAKTDEAAAKVIDFCTKKGQPVRCYQCQKSDSTN